MKINPINIEKVQDAHLHQVLLNTFADTHNIPPHSSLSVPFVRYPCKNFDAKSPLLSTLKKVEIRRNK
jgi:hypothetical protein